MRRYLGLSLVALVSGALLLGGCKRSSVAVYDVPKESVASPPLAAAAPISAPTESGWIQWTKPAAWTELAPTAFRKGNYLVEGNDGKKVEITVSSFPGAVGGTLANVNRWRGQAGLSSINSEELSQGLTEVRIDGHDGEIVNILPDSDDPDATQIVAAIFIYKGESWFFKMSGPQQRVRSQKPTFDQFIDGLKFTDAASKRESSAASSEAPKEAVLAFDAPEGWAESDGSSMRIASYEAPLEGFEPADFSITSFPGDAGGITANVNRWRQQIGLRPWSDSEVNSKRETLEVGGLDFVLFDLKPQTDADKERVKERILAGIFKHDGKSWFYKLRGDVFLVETQRSKFRQLVQSSRFEASISKN